MRQGSAKQYGGSAPLLTNLSGRQQAVAPGTPIRSALYIENTGSNNLRVMFGRPTTGSIDDFIINPGTVIPFRDPCPVESVYVSCNTTTTYAIVEITEPDAKTRSDLLNFFGDFYQRLFGSR